MPNESALSRLVAIMRRNGFAIQYVLPDPAHAISSFAYTVGLHTTTGYELALGGLSQEQTAHILPTVIERLRGQQPAAGLELDQVIAGGLLVQLTQVQQPARLAAIPDLFERVPPVWQVLWPDPQGRFPHDADYSLTPRAQPIL
jgi:hypothetical protein